MKSIKPGRGPSAMNALGAVFGIVFGIIWTAAAAASGAPAFFPAFGVMFVIIGVVQAVYHFKNATGKNRFSTFDITEDGEEGDPLGDRIAPARPREERSGTENRYCPFCGTAVEGEYRFCPKCGKELP